MTKEEIENAIGFITEIAISNTKIVNMEKIFIAKNDISNYIKDLEAENKSLKQENQKQKEILDILKPYIIVEELNGKYWLRVGGAGYDKWFVYKITKEQYELLKEWLEQ